MPGLQNWGFALHKCIHVYTYMYMYFIHMHSMQTKALDLLSIHVDLASPKKYLYVVKVGFTRIHVYAMMLYSDPVKS